MTPITYAINCDMAVLNGQIEEARKASLLSETFASDLASYLEEMRSDFILGDGVAATSTEGTGEIIYTPRLGDRFESLIATFRASQTGVAINHNSTLA